MSHDKLTFILCRPAAGPTPVVAAGEVDSADKMIGDINFFLYPDDADEAAGGSCIGEVDIMIAGRADRGKGLGKAAVSTFLHYIWTNLDGILSEYQPAAAGPAEAGGKLGLRLLMAKIKADNVGSIALFRSLGFEQEGDVNYFREIKMVLKDFESIAKAPEGYQMVEYSRPVG